jgi:hypothetical protein
MNELISTIGFWNGNCLRATVQRTAFVAVDVGSRFISRSQLRTMQIAGVQS